MTNGEVLLINPNQMKPVVAPVGLDYLAASLARHRIDFELLDLSFSEDVEQDIKRSLKAADYTYIMLEGEIVLEGEPSSLTEDEVKKAYFGI